MNKSVLFTKADSPTGLLHIADPSRHLGWIGQQFYLIAGGRHLVAASGALVQEDGRGLIWEGELTPQLSVRLQVQRSPAEHGWTVVPTLRNQGATDVGFTGYGFRAGPDQPGLCYQHPENGLPVFAHTDSLRYENLPHSRVQFPFVRSLPTAPTHLGVQSQGPLPVLVLGQTESDLWLVEGALTQQRHVISWHLGLPSRPGRMGGPAQRVHMDGRIGRGCPGRRGSRIRDNRVSAGARPG